MSTRQRCCSVRTVSWCRRATLPDSSSVRRAGRPRCTWPPTARRQASDPLRSLAEFAGDERTVVEMFANDVLRDLSPESLDFLVALAPLTRFSGAQCDAVLDRTGSAQLLEAIAIETMLVIPIDHRREWYRLHGALRDYLEAERRVRGGPSPEVVLGRASVWCEERGDIDAAIELAGAAHDVGRATDLVLGHFSTRVGSGQPLTVQRWLRDIDDTTVVTNPSLQAVAGLVRMWLGDPDGVLRCLHRAEFVLPERHPASGPLAEPAACVAALRALLGSISAQEMRDEARYARQHATSPVWFAIACLADGGSSLMLGELDTAEESLRRAAALGEACNATTWAFSLAALALLHDRAGERERAIAGARALRGRWSSIMDSAPRRRCSWCSWPTCTSRCPPAASSRVPPSATRGSS